MAIGLKAKTNLMGYSHLPNIILVLKLQELKDL